MIPYIFLLLIPLAFCYVAFERKQRAGFLGYLGKNDYIRSNNAGLSVFFFLLFLLLALRAESIGNDTSTYHYYFDVFQKRSLEQVLSVGQDTLYWLLTWFVGQITDQYQVFLAVVAALCLWPLAVLYREEREHSILKILIFVNMSTFVVLFSGLRQMLAVAAGVIAYTFVRKRRLLLFLIFSCIAVGFHHSAFMVFFMYPVYHLTFKRKHLLFVVPAMIAVFIFGEPLFLYLANLYWEGEVAATTGAFMMLLLFLIMTVFCYIIPDETKMDKETFGLRNFLLLVVVIQSFASFHTLAMRMNYYYLIFVPLLMGKVLQCPKNEYRQVAKLAKAIMVVFFAAYFLLTTWSAYRGGGGALHTVPYRFFWQV